MVAVIKSSKSLRKTLNYNEKKVKEGSATFLDAGYFLQKAEKLSFESKLLRLAERNALNERVRANTLHVSLNFAPGENLSQQQLREIAATYLNKIGFSRQPYLLYAHHDSAHPHVHLITTTVKADGSSINLHNIGAQKSRRAVKQIEAEFGLARMEYRKRGAFEIEPGDLRVVHYGKSPTKKAIENVLVNVLRDYKYCSLAELNAVLKQYNVLADRGSKNSRLYKRSGLIYRLLDDRKRKVGVPVNASDFDFKPTLKNLESRFAANQAERLKYCARVRNVIDYAFMHQRHSVESLGLALKKEGIQMLFNNNEQQDPVYIDLKTKCVFEGSILGKNYGAVGICQRCVGQPENGQALKQNISAPARQAEQQQAGQPGFEVPAPRFETEITKDNPARRDILRDLFSPVSDNSELPWQLKKRKKKKVLGK